MPQLINGQHVSEEEVPTLVGYLSILSSNVVELIDENLGGAGRSPLTMPPAKKQSTASK